MERYPHSQANQFLERAHVKVEDLETESLKIIRVYKPLSICKAQCKDQLSRQYLP